MKAKETAVVLIEFQNDFCKEDGKLHDGVKGELERQNTIIHHSITPSLQYSGTPVVLNLF